MSAAQRQRRAQCCGRCGVYKHLHPTNRCTKATHRWWWQEHSLGTHVATWAWLHLTWSRLRWAICSRMSVHRGGWRCWCQLVDVLLTADQWSERRADYAGPWSCLCDVPTPWSVRAPRRGWCYCMPLDVV